MQNFITETCTRKTLVMRCYGRSRLELLTVAVKQLRWRKRHPRRVQRRSVTRLAAHDSSNNLPSWPGSLKRAAHLLLLIAAFGSICRKSIIQKNNLFVNASTLLFVRTTAGTTKVKNPTDKSAATFQQRPHQSRPTPITTPAQKNPSNRLLYCREAFYPTTLKMSVLTFILDTRA